MLANRSQSRSYWRIFGGSRLLWRGSTVALAALSIITGFGISELTARSGSEVSGETVNRILKGDRSPLAFRIHDEYRAPASPNRYTARNSLRVEIAGWLQIPG